MKNKMGIAKENIKINANLKAGNSCWNFSKNKKHKTVEKVSLEKDRNIFFEVNQSCKIGKRGKT